MDHKIHPWQEKLLVDIKSGGLKPGEMTIMMAGRGAGKSQVAAFTRLWQDIFESSSKVSELILSEGTIYGSRYHTVEPVGGSWHEMEAWCFETFGGTGSLWNETKNLTPEPLQRWYMNNRKFWFKEEKDRDWFVIRWNS